MKQNKKLVKKLATQAKKSRRSMAGTSITGKSGGNQDGDNN